MYDLLTIAEEFRDFMERGGSVLIWIFVTGGFLWALIIERIIYFAGSSRRDIRKALAVWEARRERKSWYARKIRRALISQVSMNLNANLTMIKGLTILCPLFGLLGTLLGMIEMFDMMAALGHENIRAMASSVSKATIPAMAGILVAMTGICASALLRLRAQKETALLEDNLLLDR